MLLSYSFTITVPPSDSPDSRQLIVHLTFNERRNNRPVKKSFVIPMGGENSCSYDTVADQINIWLRGLFIRGYLNTDSIKRAWTTVHGAVSSDAFMDCVVCTNKCTSPENIISAFNRQKMFWDSVATSWCKFPYIH